MHDEPEFEEYAAPPFSFMKLIPIIAALILVGGIASAYQPLATIKCSDPVTNASFNLLATELPKALANASTNIAVECLAFLFSLFALVRKWRKADLLDGNTRWDMLPKHLIYLRNSNHNNSNCCCRFCHRCT